MATGATHHVNRRIEMSEIIGIVGIAAFAIALILMMKD